MNADATLQGRRSSVSHNASTQASPSQSVPPLSLEHVAESSSGTREDGFKHDGALVRQSSQYLKVILVNFIWTLTNHFFGNIS